MKPNLVIVQPPETAADSAVEEFCEKFCQTHYVYLVRPGSGFREDSPAGIRFLNHSLDRLPGFSDVHLAIAVKEAEVERCLRQAYPGSISALLDPAAGDSIRGVLDIIKDAISGRLAEAV